MLVPLSTGQDFMVSLVYSTDENFTGAPVYREGLNTTYLHVDAAKLFIKAVNQSKALGLKLKIWDAFRPLEAQQVLWSHVKDERYVSHPATGIRPHCRGTALDLTLTDNNDCELDMGTGFDDFSDQAHQHCLSLSQKVQKNRILLAGIMHTCGFTCHPFEWWHFQLVNAENYPVLEDSASPVSMMPA